MCCMHVHVFVCVIVAASKEQQATNEGNKFLATYKQKNKNKKHDTAAIRSAHVHVCVCACIPHSYINAQTVR